MHIASFPTIDIISFCLDIWLSPNNWLKQFKETSLKFGTITLPWETELIFDKSTIDIATIPARTV